MLLAIAHDDAEFIGLGFNGVLLAIHGAKIEHCGSCGVAPERPGHAQQNPKGQLPSQWICAGSVGERSTHSFPVEACLRPTDLGS